MPVAPNAHLLNPFFQKGLVIFVFALVELLALRTREILLLNLLKPYMFHG